MIDILKFGVSKSYKIENENIGAILFDINALKSDDAVADISNLNKIRIDLSIKREGTKPRIIYKGFLQNLLNILYQQSTELELMLKKLDSGYKVMLKFRDKPITLIGEDQLILDVEFPTSAFTSSVASKSTVEIETIEANFTNVTGTINVYESFVPSSGQSYYDKNIGNNVEAVLLEVDNSETFDATSKAKPVSVELLADGNIAKKQTQNALIAMNMNMLHYNPESSVKNLWIYNSGILLQNSSIRLTFDKAVDESSLVQVKRLVYA